MTAPARPVPPAEQLVRWLGARVTQREAFVGRCTTWAAQRGSEVLSWPDDEAAIVALGVPCDDCVTVVDDLGAGEGRARHVLQVTGQDGRHWARGIVARCGRAPRWPA